MLARSAFGSQKDDGDVFHDASEGAGPTSHPSLNQQQASREYGRRQIQATDGNDLDMQGLSIADNGTGTGIPRASTEPAPTNETNPNTGSSTDSIANKKNGKAAPQENIRPQDRTLRRKPSDADLQDQAHTQSQLPVLPHPDQHSPYSIISPETSNDPNHTSTTSRQPKPLPRLPPSFNPTNTTDTTVDTTVAPPVTHETRHTKRVEVVQEAITRDIHVDHYYHYIQPVKVVEVNPARHFTLNSKGEKVSIAAPEGWEMPSDMSVRRGPDFVNGDGRDENKDLGKGALGWERRDYVVDEENPKGRMLSAEELEQERRKGHLISPVGGGSDSGSGKGTSSPVRDSEPGIAR
jgi:hypothetical protein